MKGIYKKMCIRDSIYTTEGKELVHKELAIQGRAIMEQMARNPVPDRSVELSLIHIYFIIPQRKLQVMRKDGKRCQF